MGKTYLDKLNEQKQEMTRRGMQTGEQFALDMVEIALHRAGWGYDRVKRLIDDVSSISDYYAPAFYPNPEQEIWQARIDAELRDLIKDKQKFADFEQRYEWVNQIGKKPMRNDKAIEHKSVTNVKKCSIL